MFKKFKIIKEVITIINRIEKFIKNNPEKIEEIKKYAELIKELCD